MTTRTPPPRCDEIRMAALARLDGEPALLTAAEVEAHTGTCRDCQAALPGLSALHGALDRLDYERLEVQLWPAIRQGIVAGSAARSREIGALLGLTAALVAWRLAQLLFDWPAPVVNSIVPLALVVFVLRRLTGDPFAIRSSSHLREQEGVS